MNTFQYLLYVTEEDNKNEWEIVRTKDGYEVIGPAIDRLLARVNFEEDESMKYFQRIIYRLGIEDKLAKMEIPEGTVIKVGTWEFEYFE